MKRNLFDFLFATDMDDTLLDSQKNVSLKNREAIRRFMEQGGRFTIATGRAIPATRPYVRSLGVKCPCILYNGAAIYDFNEEKMLWTALLPPVARNYFREILDAFPQVGAEILMGDQIYVLRNNVHISRHIELEQIPYQEVALDQLSDGWFKILFVMDSDVLPKVWDYILSRQYPGVDFVKSSDNYLEMMPLGVSKGTALLRLAKLLGISETNTAAIGDYNNDIEMLKLSKLGFAVETASDEVKQAADVIAPDCNHDAVAWALDYLDCHKNKI